VQKLLLQTTLVELTLLHMPTSWIQGAHFETTKVQKRRDRGGQIRGQRE